MPGFSETIAAHGFWAPKATWSVDDIPDLTGKVVIVTGANTGIGKVTAQHLLSHNAKVYAACRSADKAEAAMDELKKVTGKTDIHFLKLDLGSIHQATQAALDFLKLESRLDILINSAGVMFTPEGAKTSDGYDMQFGTNVLGHHAFTKPLLPLLRAKGKISSPGSVRIVWVSSSGHFAYTTKEGINYDAVIDDSLINSQRHYGDSKLANIHQAQAAGDILKADGVMSLSLHPGPIASDLTRHTGVVFRVLASCLLYPVTMGCLTQLYAATSPELTMQDTKAYLIPWARISHPSTPVATDPVAIQRTWDFCEAQVAKTLAAAPVAAAA